MEAVISARMYSLPSVSFRVASLLAAVCFGFTAKSVAQSGSDKTPPKAEAIPVILDTDIGDDIDDTWAIGLLLRCPELDLKLVVGDNGKVEYRAKLLAKFLQSAGRGDVPLGIGLGSHPGENGPQQEWVKDYDLKSYPGKILTDGTQAIIDTIMKSPRPVTIIAIGPVQNLQEALRREPGIAGRARFVGMHGSIRVGYGGKPKPDAEYNVAIAAKACRDVFTAPWDMTITPLDTCDKVVLSGKRYQALCESKDPIAALVLTNYRLWAASRSAEMVKATQTQSTTLYDTVAVYLAFRQDWCGMENIGIRVTDDGHTVEDPQAKKINTAMSWKNLDAFDDFLLQRLTGSK